MSGSRGRLGAVPIRLTQNRVRLFYRGGALIDEFRGAAHPTDGDRPEDWIGSVTPFGESDREADEGHSVVALDGRRARLADLIREHPDEILGAEVRARLGETTGLLVKLLDPSERLPVHCHPTRAFARRHLGSPFGKTEAWIVIRTRGIDGESPYVRLGFVEDISEPLLRRWVERQDATALLRATHRLPVRDGSVVFVPGGMPHAIGPGVFMVELQEPTNFSVLLEHAGFPIDPGSTHLGLGWDIAITAVDRSGYPPSELSRRFVRTAPTGYGDVDLLGPDAAAFFGARLVRLRGSETIEVAAGFYIGIVIEGSGDLVTALGRFPLRRGDSFLAPAALGDHQISPAGELSLIRCLPPVLPTPSETAVAGARFASH